MNQVIDVCCGGKMWWYNKTRNGVLFMDKREISPGSVKGENWSCQPDLIGDYRAIPFDDETFYKVVCDPPHKIKGDSGIITTKYGFLGQNWQDDLSKMFNECWRILKPGGSLIIKWADVDVPPRKILDCFFDWENRLDVSTHTKKGVNNTYFFSFYKDMI